MAAIGRKASTWLLLAAALSLVPAPMRADDLLDSINRVAGGLSNNNAGDALSAFDKSFSGYPQLERYFDGLCGGYLVTNEAQLLDQNESGDAASLTVHWTMTLNSQGTNESIRHSDTVHIQLNRKKNKWKIVDLSPVSFFDPQRK
jgi:hypothetical protein